MARSFRRLDPQHPHCSGKTRSGRTQSFGTTEHRQCLLIDWVCDTPKPTHPKNRSKIAFESDSTNEYSKDGSGGTSQHEHCSNIEYLHERQRSQPAMIEDRGGLWLANSVT
jgi:hypothetical protein